MMRNRLTWGIGIVVVGVLVVGGLLLYADWFGFEEPTSGTAVAPTLETAAAREQLYRIDPTQSVVTYRVDEIFVGQEMSTAVGQTNQIAGDILLNTADYAQSQVGTVVINVEQFTSDSSLRDRRIRREFLESSAYPEAVFVPQELIGFPAEVVVGSEYTFEMRGDLTVRETTLPVTWAVTAMLGVDALRGSASTVILLSEYDVGPIDVAGLVTTSDEVALSFEFVALPVVEAALPTP
jgi:polyisoprenoid-binding protein YceI